MAGSKQKKTNKQTEASSDKKYNPSEIEAKWQAKWVKDKTYQPDLDNAKKPFYNLMMFPYPSAEGMHVGNMYAFTGSDVYGRFKRMQGNDVFEPIGLDGFGIHSENYALKVGRHPKEQAKISQENFYRQMRAIGNGFAWDNKLETYDPDYYKWTQWIFIQLFKAGLAYRKKASVNFCPQDKTVLADEQVIAGCCERCGAEVVKKELEQWFFKITNYAERLLNNIEKLDWTEKVKIAQREWIGKSEGAEVEFAIKVNYNFVLLHGFNGAPERDFHPWLKKSLEDLGYKVQVPRLPNSDNPTEDEQVEYVLKNVKFDENTILQGHSLGSAVSLKVIERLDSKIAGLVLAAGFVEPRFLDHERPFKTTFKWNFDFENIKNKVGFVKILSAENDSAVPREQGEILRDKLGGELIRFVAQGDHITGAKEPELLSALRPSIKVFTTRPDTLYGATFMVLAPEHPIANEAGKKNKEVEEYIKTAQSKTEQERVAEGKEKTGVDTGLVAINPVNNEEIPVWIADYVLMGYGTGAIMAVPAHDTRDFEFALKYDLPVVQVISKIDAPIRSYLMGGEEISSKDLQELGIKVLETTKEGYRKLEIPKEKIEEYEKLIVEKMTPGFWNEYISREIVFIFKDKAGKIKRFVLDKENEEEIDRLGEEYNGRVWKKKSSVWKWLAKNDTYTDLIIHNGPGEIINSQGWDEYFVPDGIGKIIDDLEIRKIGRRKVQYHLRDWLISRQRYWGPPIPMINCEKCGWQPVPEEDLPVLLPEVEDWKPKGDGQSPLANIESFVNTKCPNCGGPAKRETDVSDTFLDSAWYFFRYPAVENKEKALDDGRIKKWLPVNMYIGGAEHSVLHLLYSRFITMVFKDLKLIEFEEPYSKFRAHGLLIKEGAKMSKSKGNVVIPDEYIRKFGADTLRLYLMFLGPFKQGGDFYDTGIEGMHRFVKRVWVLANSEGLTDKTSQTGLRMIHKTIKKVTEDIEHLRYNTAIAALMEFYNFLSKQQTVSKEEVKIFILLISPFSPHVCEEMWQIIGEKNSVHTSSWPKVDEKYLVEKNATIIVQVNGRVRDTINADLSDINDKQKIEEIAKASPKVEKHLNNKPIRKVIYIEGKVINFVI